MDTYQMLDSLQNDFVQKVIAFMEKFSVQDVKFFDWVTGYSLYDIGKKNGLSEEGFIEKLGEFLLVVEVLCDVKDAQVVAANKQVIRFDQIKMKNSGLTR